MSPDRPRSPDHPERPDTADAAASATPVPDATSSAAAIPSVPLAPASASSTQPVSDEAQREVLMTPAEAVARMRIRVPERGNRKLRDLIERVNEDTQLKAWWHVANINAVARLEINDHSWVHIQIVTNIALKLLRQLTKHQIEPALVRDYGMTEDDDHLRVVLLEAEVAHEARLDAVLR